MWVVILLLGLAFILLIRTIVKGSKEPQYAQEVALAGGGVDYLADDDITDLTDIDGITDLTDLTDITREMYGEGDIMARDLQAGAEPEEDLELRKKPSGLEQIERFIDKDPASVAQLLRNWLSDEE
jgi:flagellar biosynthesis/type III secretory pathway M-ring protein FliF/YscJ